MHFLKMALYSLACIGLGIGLATYDISGRTPVEHGLKWLTGTGTQRAMATLRNGTSTAFETAKDKLTPKPRETYTEDDRAALNRVVAHRQEKSR